ncbi:DNA/RNA non-specific endonuclease [Flavobacteriales bacterium]|nr:DNA/RNA non-specific endonuclease [Flavobacteriales bacterium]
MKRFNTFVLFLLYVTSSAAQDGMFKPLFSGTYLSNPNYLVDFDEESRIAFWVHYELRSNESSGSVLRTDDFRVDSRTLRSPSAIEYRGSGYDRGHLKPAGDSKSSADEMSKSFLMSNMIPQTPSLNRGIWRQLEQDIRNWSVKYGEVHISTGPSLSTKTRIGQSVRVPLACWKAVLRTSPDTAVIAFMMPNADKVGGNIEDYLISVDELESRIQIDLFPGLPDDVEEKIESEKAFEKWDMSLGGGFARSGLQCLGIAATSGLRCGNFTPNENQHCHLHQDQSDDPIDTGVTQCKGTASSTGRQCRNMIKDPTGYCHYHKPSGHQNTPNSSPAVHHGGSGQCSGNAKSTGKRCRNMTPHPSGRCHHHRE